MGFNAFMFARIDYEDMANRSNEKSIETIWHPRMDSGEDNYIFTSVNY
jgi:alpha-mannosidase